MSALDFKISIVKQIAELISNDSFHLNYPHVPCLMHLKQNKAICQIPGTFTYIPLSPIKQTKLQREQCEVHLRHICYCSCLEKTALKNRRCMKATFTRALPGKHRGCPRRETE
jgi:hypothetical protein